MNYKYKLVNKDDIILSENEHKTVQEAISQGKEGLIRLRDNTVGFHTSLIREFIETEQPTVMEEKAREEYLALPPDQRPKQTYLPTNNIRGGGFKKALGTTNDDGWKNCENCKEPHFIPDNKTLCLPCLRKTSLGQKIIY